MSETREALARLAKFADDEFATRFACTNQREQDALKDYIDAAEQAVKDVAAIGRALSARDERAEEREPTYGDLLSDVRTLCRILISECELSEASKILTQTIQARTAPPAAIRAGGTDGPK